eukprot:198721-Chlamydomonas_euryale.AAC.2
MSSALNTPTLEVPDPGVWVVCVARRASKHIPTQTARSRQETSGASTSEHCTRHTTQRNHHTEDTPHRDTPHRGHTTQRHTTLRHTTLRHTTQWTQYRPPHRQRHRPPHGPQHSGALHIHGQRPCQLTCRLASASCCSTALPFLTAARSRCVVVSRDAVRDATWACSAAASPPSPPALSPLSPSPARQLQSSRAPLADASLADRSETWCCSAATCASEAAAAAAATSPRVISAASCASMSACRRCSAAAPCPSQPAAC